MDLVDYIDLKIKLQKKLINIEDEKFVEVMKAIDKIDELRSYNSKHYIFMAEEILKLIKENNSGNLNVHIDRLYKGITIAYIDMLDYQSALKNSEKVRDKKFKLKDKFEILKKIKEKRKNQN